MTDFYSIRNALSRIDECGCDSGTTGEVETVDTGPRMSFSISYSTSDGTHVSLTINDLSDFVQKANMVRTDPNIVTYHMNISESK